MLFYFKSIEQTITFNVCFISQFKFNALVDSFEKIEYYNSIVQMLRIGRNVFNSQKDERYLYDIVQVVKQ